jgi:hypothetical protein
MSEVQGFENMHPVVAIQDNMVLIDNDRILKMREIFKLIGKPAGFVGNYLFVLQQRCNGHNFQFQC